MLENLSTLIVSPAAANASSIVATELERNGAIKVSQCGGCDAKQELATAQHQIVVLDIDRPEPSYERQLVSVCDFAQRHQIPLFWLLPFGSQDEMFRTFRPSDTVFYKPFRLSDLLAAFNSALQRVKQAKPFSPLIGGYLLDSGQLCHSSLSVDLALTDKESAIIYALNRRAPNAVSRDDLLETVWGYTPDTQTHTLETYIYRLRKKFEGAEIQLTITKDREGYKLARAFFDQADSSE